MLLTQKSWEELLKQNHNRQYPLWVIRTLRRWQKIISTMDEALKSIERVLEIDEENQYPEVANIFPDSLEIQFWNIQEIDEKNKIRQKDLFINGYYFLLQERWIGEKKELWIFPWCSPFLELPEDIESTKSPKIFILSQIKNRQAVMRLDFTPLEEEDTIRQRIQGKITSFKEKSLGHSHLSVSKDPILTKDWSFLFWYLYFYGESLKK